MSQQMCVEAVQMSALGVIDQQLLNAIDRERLTAGAPFQCDEDVPLLGRQAAALVVEIAIERLECECVHVDPTWMTALASSDVNRAVRALDVVKLDGEHLADAQTTDPHQQNERTVAPGMNRAEERLQ